MPPRTLHDLLAGLIDYAGLFPPAGLSMAEAVAEYARQRGGEHSWMLGRFVVPASRLDEFETAAEAHLPHGDDAEPWPLSALAGSDPAADRARIDAFDIAHDCGSCNGRVKVEAVEARASDVEEIERLVAAFAGLDLYVELDSTRDPAPLLQALAARGAGAKIRTGGVTADAFPSPRDVARFVRAATAAGVPFKATAGLHHPLRGSYRLTYAPDSPSATMFGFLNVFLAAAFAHSGQLDDGELFALLEERDPDAFTFDDQTVRWRDRALPSAALEAARHGAAVSYGSCSFAEPVEDLERLGLLRSTRNR